MRVEWIVAQAGREVGVVEDVQESVANVWLALAWVKTTPIDKGGEAWHSAVEDPPMDRAFRGARKRG